MDSIDYIDYDIVGYGRLLCIVPSDGRVAVRRKEVLVAEFEALPLLLLRTEQYEGMS